MQTPVFPFEKVWFGVELEDIRPQRDFSTYEGSAFELLPVIDAVNLDSTFGYLSNDAIKNLEVSIDEPVDITFKSATSPDIFKPNAKWVGKLDNIQATLPAPMPEGLRKFMSATEAQSLIPSCTACYFDLPTQAIPFTYLGEDAYIFHFYRDQQDCLFWYYYVRKTGESCILVSPLPFGIDKEQEVFSEQVIQNNVFFTASTFEEFIYRTWVENLLWFNANEDEDFDSEVARHLELYRQRYGANV